MKKGLKKNIIVMNSPWQCRQLCSFWLCNHNIDLKFLTCITFFMQVDLHIRTPQISIGPFSPSRKFFCFVILFWLKCKTYHLSFTKIHFNLLILCSFILIRFILNFVFIYFNPFHQMNSINSSYLYIIHL